MARCPRCSAELETPLGCLACGALADANVDPDSLGPFEVFGMRPSYSVHLQDLRRSLLRLSRLTHPDFFATASEEEKQRAERATATLNSAFAVLSDDAARAEHLVRKLGGPDENEERAMPQAFLAEVLEWNETLEDVRRGDAGATGRLDELRRELESRREQALREVSELLDPLPASGAASLRQARRALNVVRYVDRTLAEIESLRLSNAESR